MQENEEKKYYLIKIQFSVLNSFSILSCLTMLHLKNDMFWMLYS